MKSFRTLIGAATGLALSSALWAAVPASPVPPASPTFTLSQGGSAQLPSGQMLRQWDAKAGKAIGASLARHLSGVSSVAFSPEGTRIASGSVENTVRLWDAKASQPIGAPLTGHQGGVLAVAFSPDGRRIVWASADKTCACGPARRNSPTSGAPSSPAT